MHPSLSIIARIARIDAASIQSEWPLSRLGLNSSLGLSVLRSALERSFACRLAPLNWTTTVAAVCQAVDAARGDQAGGAGGVAAGGAPGLSTGVGVPAAAPIAAPAGSGSAAANGSAGAAKRTASGPFGGRTRQPPAAAQAFPVFGHGIDLQEIASLPVWGAGGDSDAFYRGRFTPAELEVAARRPDPRAHLCGIWCAKEAVRKSDPGLLALDFHEIGIVHDGAGAPSVRIARAGAADRLEIRISISHSAAYSVASAIVLRR